MSVPCSLSKNTLMCNKGHGVEGFYYSSGYCKAREKDESSHAHEGPGIRNKAEPYSDWYPLQKRLYPLDYCIAVTVLLNRSYWLSVH